MKFKLPITLLLFSTLMVAGANITFKEASLDFSLSQPPAKDTIVFGYNMFNWNDWANRKSAQILFGENDPTIPASKKGADFIGYPVRVFELKASFTLPKPISTYNKNYLLNHARMNRIDSYNNYSQISIDEAKVIIEPTHYYQSELRPESTIFKSKIELPSNSFISSAISWYKQNKSKNKTNNSDYSAVTTLSDITYDQELDPEIEIFLRNDVGLPYPQLAVDRFFMQSTFYADHFIRFGNTFIHFQKIDEKSTLVTVQLALSINKNILFSYFGMDTEDMLINGTSIPFCKLCAGIVELTKGTLRNMKQEFSN